MISGNFSAVIDLFLVSNVLKITCQKKCIFVFLIPNNKSRTGNENPVPRRLCDMRKIWWEMKWWVNTQNCLIAQLILRRKKSDCYKNETLTADTITSQAYSNCKQTLTKITTIVENFRMNKLGVEKGRKPCRIFSTTLIQRPYYFFIVILWTACVGRA